MDESLVEAQRIAAKGMIPPAFIIKTTLASMRTFRDVPAEQNALVTVLAQKMGAIQSLAPEQRTKLQAEATRLVGAEVYPAWDRAIKLLESVQPKATDDAGLWRYKEGADAYAFFLNRFTTTDFTRGADSPDRPATGREDRSRAGQDPEAARSHRGLRARAHREAARRPALPRSDVGGEPRGDHERHECFHRGRAQAQPVAVRSAAEDDGDRAAVPALPRSQRRRQLQPRAARRLAARRSSRSRCASSA